MCRIKKKNQKDFKKESSQEDELTISEVSLMIKRLIDESSESELAESLVNSVNNHIIKKILNSDAIDHIFCNRSLFTSYILKIFICETGSGEKFISERYESVIMTLINENNQTRDVILIEVLYSSQLQYNLISITKLVRKKIETFLRLSHQLS
jgi:isocitrate dehydrogenase kinase/phosphatase